MTVDDAKTQAKDLRLELASKGVKIGHGQALELIAQRNGASDWNTLRGRLPAADPDPFHLDQRIAGTYLGQTFSGRIMALSRLGKGFQVSIDFDAPVDVVTHDSFSNMRNKVRGVVGRSGRSDRTTSNGEPVLTIDTGA